MGLDGTVYSRPGQHAVRPEMAVLSQFPQRAFSQGRSRVAIEHGQPAARHLEIISRKLVDSAYFRVYLTAYPGDSVGFAPAPFVSRLRAGSRLSARVDRSGHVHGLISARPEDP